MPLKDVKRVNMPSFDEISVKDLWPQMKDNLEFMAYFPSKFPKSRLPDKSYFFNIMNTVMEEYVQQMIAHANKIRATKAHNAEAVQTIDITDEWYEKLKAVPFVSCKYLFELIVFQSAKETQCTC